MRIGAKTWAKLAAVVAVFLACYYLPVERLRLGGAVTEALALVRWYARKHVLLCLVPAFFIAGGISVFVSQASVMKYLGARARQTLAYAVASVSGSVLAVCSCTVLPLFAGIYRMGAGIGPATAFLYAGPAINILAIVLTANVLGWKLGLARAVGAVVFSVLIGLGMHLIFRRSPSAEPPPPAVGADQGPPRPLWKTVSVFAAMVAVLVFANWARSGDVRAVFLCCPDGLAVEYAQGRLVAETDEGIILRDPTGQELEIPADRLRGIERIESGTVGQWVGRLRWVVVAAALAALLVMLARWFRRDELGLWVESSWGFALQILPLLLVGVLAAGLLLGGRGAGEGLIPNRYVEMLVGSRPQVFLDATGLAGGPAEGAIRAAWPVLTNLFASVVGAFMYFATLTEVPILEGLIRSGMGKGPALALLLAGPAISLPNMLVIRSIIGTRKTLAYVALVVVMATISGLIFGAIPS